MPKTKVRKSRTRKSGMRKSLRIKRGGTRDKPNRTESKAAKSEHKIVVAQKSDNTDAKLSLPAHYFEGGPSYFRPTSKQVSELLNTKKTSGNNVPYVFRKDRNLTLGEELDTN